MTRWFWSRLLVAGWLALWLPQAASAHQVGSSYLELGLSDEHELSGRWRVGLRDLDAVLELDRDGDGLISDAELEQRRAALESYLLARLELTGGGRSCPLSARGASSSAGYLELQLGARCEGPLSLRYDLFFDHDRSHQGHLRLVGTLQGEHLLTSEQRSVPLAAGAGGPVWLEHLRQGVEHILSGFDHLLFLLTLLLSVLVSRRGAEAGAALSLRAALLEIAKIVTAFTAAHSLTLSLMALGLVSLPSRWVETAIALSIVAAAANNVWPVVTRRVWLLAFGFGLLHGLGFGGALRELGLPERQLLLALLGFNLGVELGQLAVVASCLLLVAGLLRLLSGSALQRWREHGARMRQRAVVVGSGLVAAVGLLWSLERALDVDFASQLGRGARATQTEPRCDALAGLRRPEALSAVRTGMGWQQAGQLGQSALERACAGDLAAAAHGFEQALAESDGAAELEHAWLLRTAADVALARGEPREAERLLSLAERIWRAQGAPAREVSVALAGTLARLAELMAREERWADVYRLYDEARALYEAAGDARGLAQAHSRLGDVLVSAADPPAAKRQYDRARSAYEQLGDEAGMGAQYRNLAIVARLNGDDTEAAQMYRRALALHRSQGHPPEIAADLAALARIQLGTAQYDEAQALYEEANTLERELGRSRALARNYNQLGNLHQLRGDLPGAEAQYREALAFSEQAGDDTEAANNCANLAAVYHKQGERRRARELYEKSLALFQQSGAHAKVQRVRGLLASLDTGHEANAR